MPHSSGVPSTSRCSHRAAKATCLSAGVYQRGVTGALGHSLEILIARFLCRACGGTVSYLPDFALSYRLVAVRSFEAYLDAHYHRREVHILVFGGEGGRRSSKSEVRSSKFEIPSVKQRGQPLGFGGRPSLRARFGSGDRSQAQTLRLTSSMFPICRLSPIQQLVSVVRVYTAAADDTYARDPRFGGTGGRRQVLTFDNAHWQRLRGGPSGTSRASKAVTRSAVLLRPALSLRSAHPPRKGTGLNGPPCGKSAVGPAGVRGKNAARTRRSFKTRAGTLLRSARSRDLLPPFAP